MTCLEILHHIACLTSPRVSDLTGKEVDENAVVTTARRKKREE